jgi:hypothetical protein
MMYPLSNPTSELDISIFRQRSNRKVRLLLKRLVIALQQRERAKASSLARSLGAELGAFPASIAASSFTFYSLNGGEPFTEDVADLDPDQLSGVVDSLLRWSDF